jgi:hypothetical protein
VTVVTDEFSTAFSTAFDPSSTPPPTTPVRGFIFVDTLVRLRAQTRTNRGGDEVPDWSQSPDRLTITRVSVQPNTQGEAATVESNVRTERWRVLSEPGTAPDVHAQDRVEFHGQTFDVDGDVAMWPDPFSGYTHHVEFAIRRDEGG